MVDGIGSGAGRGAINDALKRMQSRSRELGATEKANNGLGSAALNADQPDKATFGETLREGIGAVENQIDRANGVHIDVLEGRVDLHEVAAQLKESEITFQFALQVRNKLMDAYREVMRMSV